MKDSDSENLLVQALDVKLGLNGEPDFVTLNTLGGLEVLDSDTLKANWIALHNSDRTKQLAEDMVRYSFYTSALKPGRGAIHTMVDTSILEAMGTSENEYQQLKNQRKDHKHLFKIMMRNSWKDTKTVPVVSKKGTINVKLEGMTSKQVFKASSESSPSLVVGYSKDSDTVFKPYVTKKTFSNGVENVTLYEYRGNVTNIVGVDEAVYVAVNKLGNNSKYGGNMYEFPSAGSNYESIIESNNAGLEVDEAAILGLEAKYPGAVHTKVLAIDNESLDELLDNEKPVSEELPNIDTGEISVSHEQVEFEGETFSDSSSLREYLEDNNYAEWKINEILEEVCSGGSGKSKPKAENGAQFGFTKGGKWKVIKDFKGASHENGGIDINVSGKGISMSRKNGKFKAEFGMVIGNKEFKK